MEILYPQSVTDITAVESVKMADKMAEEVKEIDKSVAIDFIKGLVADNAMSVADICQAMDDNYVKTNDENYHWLAQDVRAMCEDIDMEWRPAATEVAEPANLKSKMIK